MFFRKPKLNGKVSILIAVRGDSRYTLELCLKSIRKNTDYPDYKIIICDDGVDGITLDYLSGLVRNKEIDLVKSTNPGIPKDDLVRAVDTEYYIFMHDDIRILKKNWLTKRLHLMNRDMKNAIVGPIVNNFGNNKIKRFLPLGLLVRADVSKKLGLIWGKQPEKGLDTGGLAYQQFFSQYEFKFINLKISGDIYHFGGMTWVTCKGKDFPDRENLLKERSGKIAMIKEMLASGAY